jgi:hypothetical protein
LKAAGNRVLASSGVLAAVIIAAIVVTVTLIGIVLRHRLLRSKNEGLVEYGREAPALTGEFVTVCHPDAENMSDDAAFGDAVEYATEISPM